MGILFPLVIPTICELESAHGAQCRVDIIIQSAAAIMASSIFGNGKIFIPNSHVGSKHSEAYSHISVTELAGIFKLYLPVSL